MKFKLLIIFSSFFVLTNCNKDNLLESDPTNSWISELASIYDSNGQYELEYLSENQGYLAVGFNNIIEISKDGMLLSYKEGIFTKESFRSQKRVYNNSIFSFSTTNRFSEYNANDKVNLNIYNISGDLIESTELNTTGILFDVEMESENIYGMLLYDPDNTTMSIKRIDKNRGIISEAVLDRTGTSPTNLHISENSNYLCTASSNDNNFHYLDSNLNSLISKTFKDLTISDAEVVEDRGIFIAGSVAFSDDNYVAIVSFNGDIIKEVFFESKERHIDDLIINDQDLAISECEGEERLNFRLSCLSLDLETNFILNTTGYLAGSNLVINENNGYTYMNGAKTDSIEDTFYSLSHPRFIKLNIDCREPENYIIQ